MDELVGLTVKVTLNSASGLMVTTGKVTRVDKDYILINTFNGPVYIFTNFIKTVSVVKDSE